MVLLEPPYEILELEDGQSISFTPLKWEEGEIIIKPRYPEAPPTKTVTALRVYVSPEIKPTLPHRWDITASTLVEGLREELKKPDFTKKVFTITKIGVRPRARFTLKVEPLKE